MTPETYKPIHVHGAMQSIISSNVAMVGYLILPAELDPEDTQEKALYLIFNNGVNALYTPFSAARFDGMMDADSVGVWLNANVYRDPSVNYYKVEDGKWVLKKAATV